VDQDGIVLDIRVQSRRDKGAAKRLLRKLLKRQCRVPRVMITDETVQNLGVLCPPLAVAGRGHDAVADHAGVGRA